MKRTFNLNCRPEPLNGLGPYMTQDAVDRVLEHLREGDSVQMTVCLDRSCNGTMESHRDRLLRTWADYLQRYNPCAELVKPTINIESTYAIVIMITLASDART